MKTLAICLTLAIVLLCPAASAQWVRTNDPCPDFLIWDAPLAVSGTNLFAGTWDGGVFRSTDNGISWTAVNTGLLWHLFGGYYGAVICFAVSGTNLFAGGHDGVYLSTDDGTNWKAVSAGLPWYAEGEYYRHYPVSCLAVSGMNLFAGTESDGVFLRASNATSWAAAQTPFENFSQMVQLGPNLFAGAGGYVFLSTNNGASWTAVNTGLHAAVICLAVSGTNLFAGASWGVNSGGVFRSTNNGTNWTYVSSTFPYTRVNALAVSGTNLLAGCGGSQIGMRGVGGPGVFLSTNDGTSWIAVNEGLPRFDSYDTAHYVGIAGLVVSGTYLFATTEHGRGIFRRPLSEMMTSTQSSSNQLPVAFTLIQNYPNPFNPTTTIKYELPRTSNVTLSVYDLLGRQVSVLVNERRSAGVHEAKFDGSNLASGVYFYRLQAGDFAQTKRLLLLK